MSSALVLPAAAAATPPQELPGHRAMWVAICLEFLEFAVFFAVYFSARWHHPRAFQEGAHRLWTSGGVAITAAMVSSGWMLTRVLAAMRAVHLADAPVDDAFVGTGVRVGEERGRLFGRREQTREVERDPAMELRIARQRSGDFD